MKQPINEIKRMQQLAGLVNENINEMKDHSKWNIGSSTPEELAAMDKVIKAGNDKYDAERKAEREKKQANKTEKDVEDIDEGIGKTLGTAALGAALAFGSPEKGMAQTKQGIETQVKLSDEETGDKLWHAYSEHRSTINLSGLSPEVVKAISMAEKEANESGYPYETIKKLGQAAKKDQAAMEIVNTDEAVLRSSSKDAIEAAKRKGLEEVVNEALRKFRKDK
jgi:hypothetical protein